MSVLIIGFVGTFIAGFAAGVFVLLMVQDLARFGINGRPK